MENDSIYVIGDVHGCLPSLVELMERLEKDVPLVFCGDIVNRGPFSLETLRFVKSLGDRARVLLGNHDLHLLATAAGHGRRDRRDTLDEILEAPDCGELVDYLRNQHLLIAFKGFTLVHAGIDPAWTLEEAVSLAREAESLLRSEGWRDALSDMYGKDLWRPDLSGHARLRAILNGLTRIRYVTREGVPQYRAKLSPKDTDPELVPWFDAPQRKTRGTVVVAGHWSTLGLCQREDFIGIDTGCIWGGELTAVRLPERRFVQVKAPAYQDPLRF